MTIKEWIKSKLNGYEIVEEIKTGDEIYDKYIMISCLGGDTVYATGQQLTYQLTVRTTTPLSTLEELKQFVLENTNTYFNLDEEWQLKAIINYPYKSQAFQEAYTKYYAEFIIPIFFIATKSIQDISKVLIDNEKVDVIGFVENYSTLLNNHKEGTKELNTTDITYAILQFSINYVNTSSIFNSKIRDIKYGKKPKNTSFKLKITYNDGYIAEFDCKIQSVSFRNSRSELPTSQIVLQV